MTRCIRCGRKLNVLNSNKGGFVSKRVNGIPTEGKLCNKCTKVELTKFMGMLRGEIS